MVGKVTFAHRTYDCHTKRFANFATIQLRPHALPDFRFLFPEQQHVHQLPVIINIIDKLYMSGCPLFRNLFIFLRDASLFIADDELLALVPTGIYH
jgi:hypothetical protein